MDTDRKAMEAALKERCVPILRKMGFKGSFPDFYRDTSGFVALVNFQFFSSGGSFCVNLSYADQDRKNVDFRPHTEAKKLRVSHTRERHRLGAVEGDRWFSFGKTSYGEYRGKPAPVAELAATCGQLLEAEAEDWWRSMQAGQASQA